MNKKDRFYHGNGSDLGNVQSLNIATFQELVDRKINVPVTLNVTQDQYKALPKAEKNAKKKVPYLVPCTFEDKQSRRLTELARTFNLAFLDIDEGAHARPYYDSPETLAEQLAPLNFAMYSTASSTDENPRIRIMVEADNIPVALYKKAVHYLAEKIGLAEITTESLKAVQPMYLPTMFADQCSEVDHPLKMHNTGGQALKASTLEDYEPENVDAPLKEEPVELSGDALDFLRPKVEGITLDHARDALKHIDPDCEYHDWLIVAAAFRHQFTGEEAEEAFELFDEWSSEGSKYVGSEDTRAKWKSFEPNPNKVPMTMRTLMKKAEEGGWDSKDAKNICFTTTQQFLQSAHHTNATLLSEGLGRILGTGLTTHAEEEALLNLLRKELKTRFGYSIALTALRKDLNKMREEINKKKRKKRKVEPWAKGIVYVQRHNEFFRPSNNTQFNPEALDLAYGKHLLPTPEQVAMSGAVDTISVESKPIVRARDYLLNKLEIPQVYEYAYDPRCPNDLFITKENQEFVNTYVQNFPEPIEEGAEEAGAIFLDHIDKLIAEPEYRTVFMDFLAYIVQCSGEKIRWAPLIQGAEGCGKSVLAKAMLAILGKGNVKPIDDSAIKSGYNDWAGNAQLIVVEEVRVAGHNRHDIMNVLKPLITNDDISVNEKFKKNKHVENLSNYVLFTNFHDALALSKGDRRYFVLKSALQTKQQVQALGHAHFDRLHHMIENCAAQLRFFFANWQISENFNPQGHAPETRYLRQLINDSATESNIAISNILTDGNHPMVQPDCISPQAVMSTINGSGFTKVSLKQVTNVLVEMGLENVGRFSINGVRQNLWVTPTSPVGQLTHDALRIEVENRIDLMAEDCEGIL